MEPFPLQHELIELFEAEPELSDPDVPWAYNGLRFQTTRGKDEIDCEIEPGYGILRVRWMRDGTEIVNCCLETVRGLTIDVERGREVLVASLVDVAGGYFRLQMKPQVHVSWATGRELRP